ncbi:Hypothetical protein PBC10988_0470 [Planctomycetales bacterium 10988]|nr:Hypothetical protein PBC10988_0470 [Planctomycetales bacterium 10988]
MSSHGKNSLHHETGIVSLSPSSTHITGPQSQLHRRLLSLGTVAKPRDNWDIPSYIDLLKTNELVNSEKLDRILHQMDVHYGEKNYGVEELANLLIRTKHLSYWQHHQLLQGHDGGFHFHQYTLLDCLGKGGMATVYLARHKMMRRKVAIKVFVLEEIAQQLKHDSQQVLDLRRFQNECQVMASFDHPGIVRAFDFNQLGQIFYLVLEYVPGANLEIYTREQGPLDYIEAARYILEAADALGYAHQQQVVHRDVKPSNLIRTTEGRVKLLDLGLARIELPGEESITLCGSPEIMGTVDYLAPEQARDSHEVDYRADIYSLGCTLYYLLAGQVPFPKGSLPQRLLAQMTKEPEPLANLRSDVPPFLVDLCRDMMIKDREKRIQTMEEIVNRLRAWLDQQGVVLEAEPRQSDGSIHTAAAERPMMAAEEDTSSMSLSSVRNVIQSDTQNSETVVGRNSNEDTHLEMPLVGSGEKSEYVHQNSHSGSDSPSAKLSQAILGQLHQVLREKRKTLQQLLVESKVRLSVSDTTLLSRIGGTPIRSSVEAAILVSWWLQYRKDSSECFCKFLLRCGLMQTGSDQVVDLAGQGQITPTILNGMVDWKRVEKLRLALKEVVAYLQRQEVDEQAAIPNDLLILFQTALDPNGDASLEGHIASVTSSNLKSVEDTRST